MEQNLYIKAKEGKGPSFAEVNKWVQVQQNIEDYIKNIASPEGTEADVSSFNTLVSGVPNPWARAKLTEYAFISSSSERNSQILSQFYSSLESEWRGLFAAYTLFPDRFELSEPIDLQEQSIQDRRGKFKILSVYSEMLFEDKNTWKHDSNTDSAPKMQLLFFNQNGKKILVGATSPYTIFFTSTNYQLSDESDISWITRDGKFIDPLLNNNLNQEQRDKLFSYIKEINQVNRGKYCNELLGICGSAADTIAICINAEFESWYNQLETGAKKCPVIRKDSIIPQGPLATLLKTDVAYYWTGNSFATNSSEGSTKIEKPSELLLDSLYLAAWRAEGDEDKNKFRNSAVYYVEAQDENTEVSWFFALPLSEKAKEIFLDENELPLMLSGKSENVRFYAEYKVGGRVQIVLKARIMEEFLEIVSREYTIEELDRQKKAFIWPDFYSEVWEKYYFYSEYPHNNNGIKLIPYTENGCVDLGKEADITSSGLLVSYPVGKVASDMHRYEIVRTSEPLQYLEMRETKKEQEVSLGFLLIKRKHANGYKGKEIIYISQKNLTKVTVGIDFGSTNSCLYYKADKDDPQPIKFQNRRVALIGFDNETKKLANPDELLFITNEESTNGQIKSWLHEHDSRYVNQDKLPYELIGGVPVNEKNILLKDMDEKVITTNAGKLNYNMKWLTEGGAKKTSFMRMVWIQACADLFADEKCPSKIKWSYPGAMAQKRKNDIQDIYIDCCNCLPIKDQEELKEESMTESFAVCAYACSREDLGLSKKIFLGIDIGGSTSDILILGQKGTAYQLYNQSSLRIAAGRFFDVIQKSSDFKKALVTFHNSGQSSIKVHDIDRIIKEGKFAPYYLDSVFDQLEQDEFRKFYSEIRKGAPSAFALPAYITGVLCFYAGQLIASVINKENLDIKEINFCYYGKGGRLFDWLFDGYKEVGKDFINKCIAAGLNTFANSIKITIDVDRSRKNNKSEVAIGLISSDKTIEEHERYDVIGEKSFTKDEKDDLAPINVEFYSHFSDSIPEKFVNFEKFIDLYLKFVGQETGIIESDIVKVLREKIDSVQNVTATILNDPEYNIFANSSDSEKEENLYRMPIFIASSLHYLNNILLPQVFK